MNSERQEIGRDQWRANHLNVDVEPRASWLVVVIFAPDPYPRCDFAAQATRADRLLQCSPTSLRRDFEGRSFCCNKRRRLATESQLPLISEAAQKVQGRGSSQVPPRSQSTIVSNFAAPELGKAMDRRARPGKGYLYKKVPKAEYSKARLDLVFHFRSGPSRSPRLLRARDRRKTYAAIWHRTWRPTVRKSFCGRCRNEVGTPQNHSLVRRLVRRCSVRDDAVRTHSAPLKILNIRASGLKMLQKT